MAIIDLIALELMVVVAVMVLGNRRGSKTADVARPIDPETFRLNEEVKELRARIHILERAITDNHGSTDLADEIDRLRDR